jgi:hypothetical protein
MNFRETKMYMGIYAVEEEFLVVEYHFEVSFRSDNAVGLCQKDEDEP